MNDEKVHARIGSLIAQVPFSVVAMEVKRRVKLTHFMKEIERLGGSEGWSLRNF